MKQVKYLFFLTLITLCASIQAMEYITLISSDGHRFSVEKDALQLSKTLWDMIESSEKVSEISLNIQKKILQHVAAFLMSVKKAGAFHHAPTLWAVFSQIKPLKLPYPELYELACTFNYLDIEPALHACVVKLAQQLKAMPKDQYNEFLYQVTGNVARNGDLEDLIGEELIRIAAFGGIFAPIQGKRICPRIYTRPFETVRCNQDGSKVVWVHSKKPYTITIVEPHPQLGHALWDIWMPGTIKLIAINATGDTLAVVGTTNGLCSIGISNKPYTLTNYPISTDFCRDIAFHGDDIRMLCIKDNTLHVYDVKTNNCIQTFSLDQSAGRVRVAEFMNAGNRVLIPQQEGKVCIFDIDAGKCVYEYTGINNMIIGHDETHLICQTYPDYYDDPKMSIFDIKTGKKVHAIQRHFARLRIETGWNGKITETAIPLKDEKLLLANDTICIYDWFNDLEMLRNISFEQKCFLMWLVEHKNTPTRYGFAAPLLAELPKKIQKFLIGNGYCHERLEEKKPQSKSCAVM